MNQSSEKLLSSTSSRLTEFKFQLTFTQHFKIKLIEIKFLNEKLKTREIQP